MTPCLSLLLAVLPAADDKPTTEKTVEKSLAYLRSKQRDDGTWRSINPTYTPAVTALAGLVFLSAGHKPGKGPEGEAVAKAVRAVLKSQREDGVIAPKDSRSAEMYTHGLAMLFLAEALASADDELARQIRPALEKAVAVTVKAQSRLGGWRYEVRSPDQDLSVTSGQMVGLKAAAAAGVTVPEETITRALRYVRSCRQTNTGGFSYTPYSFASLPCTASAGLVLLLWSGPEDPALAPALAFMNKSKNVRSNYPFYGTEYAAQFTVHLGGKDADALRTALLDELAKSKRDDASWQGAGGEGTYGPVYCTAQAILALTADQKRLRVFQPAKDKRQKD